MSIVNADDWRRRRREMNEWVESWTFFPPSSRVCPVWGGMSVELSKMQGRNKKRKVFDWCHSPDRVLTCEKSNENCTKIRLKIREILSCRMSTYQVYSWQLSHSQRLLRTWVKLKRNPVNHTLPHYHSGLFLLFFFARTTREDFFKEFTIPKVSRQMRRDQKSQWKLKQLYSSPAIAV